MAFTGETEEGEIVFMLRFSGFTSLLEADEFMAAIEDVLNKNIFMVKKDERVRPN
jgi:predicted transcriptional regulator